MNSIMYTICEQIKNISILLYPIIPMSAEKVLNSININKEEFSIEIITNFKSFDFQKELKDLEILFKKIEDDN